MRQVYIGAKYILAPMLLSENFAGVVKLYQRGDPLNELATRIEKVASPLEHLVPSFEESAGTLVLGMVFFLQADFEPLTSNF